MNCVTTQQLKGFCLIHDQDNFNIKSSVLTTKHVQRKLNNCYLNGVRSLKNVTAPTKNKIPNTNATPIAAPPTTTTTTTGVARHLPSSIVRKLLAKEKR